MVDISRKCFCDGNDDNNDNGDDDDVKIYFYKIFKGVMIYIQVTKSPECFKTFCYKLLCRRLLLVALWKERISNGIDCHIYNYVSM